MHWFSIGATWLVALAIIFVGAGYLTNPRRMAPGFGLPLPEKGANITWWLRLKGVRDLTSGVLTLAVMAWDGHQTLGIVLLAEALIPLGDMSNILAAKGSTRHALGIHGATAVLMILGAIPLIMGVT